MKTKKKNIVEKEITEILDLQLRKNKRYLVVDSEPLRSLNEFRQFQKFLENIIILSRHKRVKIKGALMIEKE